MTKRETADKKDKPMKAKLVKLVGMEKRPAKPEMEERNG